jgi:hypothetical protein
MVREGDGGGEGDPNVAMVRRPHNAGHATSQTRRQRTF